MSYENWKHILRVFKLWKQSYDGIFVIKPTYPYAMFDKLTKKIFFWWNPSTIVDLNFKNGSVFEVEHQNWVKMPNGWGLENLGILSDECRKLSDE